mgnify:CR=1 FL=1
MMTFYRTPECSRSSLVQEVLNRTGIKYSVVVIGTEKDKREHFSTNISLPLLKDEHEVYCGIEAIVDHLKQFEEFKAEWDAFQTDACPSSE